MSLSPFPAPLETITGRRFSFYPPIQNLESNEWMYRRATWTECVVVNTATGEEFSVPRSFLGEITTGNGVTVVALHRELESRGNALCPVRCPVIELPVAVNDGRRPGAPRRVESERLAPVVNIRLEQRPEVRVGKRFGVALVLGAVACTICADIARQIETSQRPDMIRLTRPYLQLSAEDDYFATVHKLGKPSGEHVVTGEWGTVYRVLDYGLGRYHVVLTGPGTNAGRYTGTLARDGRIVDEVKMPDGQSSSALLRALLRSMPPF